MHWLMLWSSSGIREARKEIGSTQSRWSKELGGLRYIKQIRLGGSIAVYVSQLHFLVDYLPLGERRRGFTHWLMLWSSSGIREARKKISSAQPCWSKKLRGFRYIKQIRLGGSIAVHISQLHFLVDYLLLEGRRRGFTPNASVSSSITHRCVVLVFASLFP